MFRGLEDTLRRTFFHVVSVMTTTGFIVEDYNLWPEFTKFLFVILMFIGASGGSTGGGCKVSRFLILGRQLQTEVKKLLYQTIIALIFFLLFLKADNEPLLWIHALNIKMDIGWFYGLFILLVLLASSNAVNLTDGLDGLAGGLSLIAFLTFGVISLNTGWLEGYMEISMFCFVLSGSILGFLLFNINPAKIFMGDTGSLALGATMGSIAILTRHELLLILIGIVFVIETLSCLIQRYYYKLTKKRLFPMAPLHHTFERIGWNERDIVKLFWTVGLIASLLAIVYAVWL